VRLRHVRSWRGWLSGYFWLGIVLPPMLLAVAAWIALSKIAS
jgi:hypothetical protein